jgi:hypothetical protein
MIGRMSKDLGMLPSYVEQHATTYDIMVMDVLNTYDNYQQAKSKGGLMDASLYKFTEEELKGMLRK